MHLDSVPTQPMPTLYWILAVAGGQVALDTIPETALMVTGIVSTLAGMILGTILAPGSQEKQEWVAHFLDGVEAKEGPQEVVASSDSSRISPAPIIGTAVTALGVLLVLVVLWMAPLSKGALSLAVGGGMIVLGLLLVAIPRMSAAKK